MAKKTSKNFLEVSCYLTTSTIRAAIIVFIFLFKKELINNIHNGYSNNYVS